MRNNMLNIVNNINSIIAFRKINLFFFDVMKSGQTFPSKVCHFQYNDRFLFSREMGNIRTCKEVCLRKPLQFRLSG